MKNLMQLIPPKVTRAVAKTAHTLKGRAPTILSLMSIGTSVGSTVWSFVAGAKCEAILRSEEMSDWDKQKNCVKQAAGPIILEAISIGTGMASNKAAMAQIASLVATNGMLMSSIIKGNGAISQEDEIILMDEENSEDDKDEDLDVIVVDKASDGGERFYDDRLNIYFRAKPARVYDAFDLANREMQMSWFTSLYSLYKRIGFPEYLIPESWKRIGWDYDTLLRDHGLPWIDYTDNDKMFDHFPSDLHVLHTINRPKIAEQDIDDYNSYAGKWMFR